MLLIADSGSTKTDWCVLDHNGCVINRIVTHGINPFLQSEHEISTQIGEKLISQLTPSDITNIYFYGAGCTFPEKNEMIRNIFSHYFSATIVIESDLMAAVHAMCGDNAGIVCILGTGSNSCQYDGHAIVKHVPPLGFILGDEGGGVSLGRQLVSDVLKNQLPKELSKEFMEEYHLTDAIILENVYKKPFPNRFLAAFTPFLSAHIENPHIGNIIRKGFESFLTRNVMQYDYHDYKIDFIGSVALHFQNILRETVESMHLYMGQIEAHPMDGLIRYYSKKNQ